MEEKIIKMDRQIETRVERENVGTNREFSLNVKIGSQTTCLPYMTEGELMQVKRALDEYFDKLYGTVVTVKEMREMEYIGCYKIVELDEEDAFRKATISKDLILRHDNNDNHFDRVVRGSVKTKGGIEIKEVYLYLDTLVKLI